MSIITKFLFKISEILESHITYKMALRADFGVAVITFDNGRTTTSAK